MESCLHFEHIIQPKLDFDHLNTIFIAIPNFIVPFCNVSIIKKLSHTNNSKKTIRCDLKKYFIHTISILATQHDIFDKLLRNYEIP